MCGGNRSAAPLPEFVAVASSRHGCRRCVLPRSFRAKRGFSWRSGPAAASRLAAGPFAGELWRRRGRGGVGAAQAARVSPTSRPHVCDAKEGVVFLPGNCLPPGLLFRF